MTDLEKLKRDIGEWLEISDKATPGPWTYDYGSIHSNLDRICTVDSCSDLRPRIDVNGNFIADARTRLPKLSRALLVALAFIEGSECLWYAREDTCSRCVALAEIMKELNE